MLSYLPVLHQSDGAIIICVMHVEQNWEERREEFSVWSNFWETPLSAQRTHTY